MNQIHDGGKYFKNYSAELYNNCRFQYGNKNFEIGGKVFLR